MPNSPAINACSIEGQFDFFETTPCISSSRPNDFEIDWIHCGQNGITGFEVGTYTDPYNPKTALQNKFEQILTIILPQFLLILHTFFTFYYKTTEDLQNNNFDIFISEHLTLLIYLPQMRMKRMLETLENWKAEMKNSRNKSLRSQVLFPLSQTPEAHLSIVKILVEDELGMFHVVQIDKDLNPQIAESSLVFENLCRTDFDTRNTSSYELLQYINALFIIASHSNIFTTCGYDKLISDRYYCYDELVRTHIDIDDRYKAALNKTKGNKKQPCNIVTELGIILSPEQLKILIMDAHYLALFGPPGTGKSLLLLAKAESWLKMRTLNA